MLGGPIGGLYGSQSVVAVGVVIAFVVGLDSAVGGAIGALGIDRQR